MFKSFVQKKKKKCPGYSIAELKFKNLKLNLCTRTYIGRGSQR